MAETGQELWAPSSHQTIGSFPLTSPRPFRLDFSTPPQGPQENGRFINGVDPTHSHCPMAAMPNSGTSSAHVSCLISRKTCSSLPLFSSRSGPSCLRKQREAEQGLLKLSLRHWPRPILRSCLASSAWFFPKSWKPAGESQAPGGLKQQRRLCPILGSSALPWITSASLDRRLPTVYLSHSHTEDR